MTDIVEQLRSKSTDCHESEEPLYLSAAAEIERLRKVEEYHDQAIERSERLEAECERLRTEAAITAGLRAALLTCPCPGGGYTGIPKHTVATVGACLEAGVCGCIYGDALKSVPT